MIDPSAKRERELKAMIWNIHRENDIRDVINNSDSRHESAREEADGWWCVSRHSSTVAAYTVQNRMRKRYGSMIDSKVVNTLDETDREWDAEIWVRKAQPDQEESNEV